MIRLAILTPNPMAAEAIEQMAQESGLFRVTLRDNTSLSGIRALGVADPEVVLLDLGDWMTASQLAVKILQTSRRAALVGFRPQWTPDEETAFVRAGVAVTLHEPFSFANLEAAAYEAMHGRRPIENANIFVFLPAKAGSGCSTVALNTAATIANGLEKKTLLIETDRRSGVLSILLNVEDRGGLSKALERSGDLTSMEWRQHLVELGQLDMLLANPADPGRLPGWVNYYQLLLFVEKQYDFVVADLPEVINPASAEVVKAARRVFIVCEPELPSLKLAALRRGELEAGGVPLDKIGLLVNRWEMGRVTQEQIMRLTGCQVAAWLPNDYAAVKNATLEGRLVARESAFGKACAELARKLGGPGPAPETPASGQKFGLLRRFGM